jgi:spermidine synthase
MKKNWFFENPLPLTKEEIKIGFKIKRKIYSEKSQYQKIEILDTFAFGKILVLDGIIQLSQKYEFIYHEMISHLSLFSHPHPKRVLIVGGGDGGTLREVLKHDLKEVFLVEIDPKVMEVSKKYLSFLKLKNSLKRKNVKIFFENGANFIKEFKNFFDVIICDSTDPSGPSKVLFSEKFYKDVFNGLSKNGIFITQGGNFLQQIFEIKDCYKKLKKIFPFVKIHRAVVFDYQLTDFSFILASKGINFEKISLERIRKRFKKIEKSLKYYSPEIHFSSGILPKFYKEKFLSPGNSDQS